MATWRVERTIGGKLLGSKLRWRTLWQGSEEPEAREWFDTAHENLIPRQSLRLIRPDGRTELIVHSRKATS